MCIGLYIHTYTIIVDYNVTVHSSLQSTLIKLYVQRHVYVQETKEPLPVEKVNALWESCKEDGVLLGKGGLYGSVRPLCVYFPFVSG